MPAGSPPLSRRRLLVGASLLATSVAAVACAAPAAPRWTFGPPSAGDAAARASASPGGPASGAGLLVRIVAEDFAFDLAEFSVPAETPFRIEFDHRDVGIPHNVAIYDSGPDGRDLFRGEIFSGADIVVYDVPGLPAGTHHFTCDPHPYMAGVVTVG